MSLLFFFKASKYLSQSVYRLVTNHKQSLTLALTGVAFNAYTIINLDPLSGDTPVDLFVYYQGTKSAYVRCTLLAYSNAIYEL